MYVCLLKRDWNGLVMFARNGDSTSLVAELGHCSASGAAVEVDLSGHRYGCVYGNSGSGKTVLMRRMAERLMERYSPSEIQFVSIGHPSDGSIILASRYMEGLDPPLPLPSGMMPYRDYMALWKQQVDASLHWLHLETLRRDVELSRNPGAEFPWLVVLADVSSSLLFVSVLRWSQTALVGKDRGVRIISTCERPTGRLVESGWLAALGRLTKIEAQKLLGQDAETYLSRHKDMAEFGEGVLASSGVPLRPFIVTPPVIARR